MSTGKNIMNPNKPEETEFARKCMVLTRQYQLAYSLDPIDVNEQILASFRVGSLFFALISKDKSEFEEAIIGLFKLMLNEGLSAIDAKTKLSHEKSSLTPPNKP